MKEKIISLIGLVCVIVGNYLPFIMINVKLYDFIYNDKIILNDYYGYILIILVSLAVLFIFIKKYYISLFMLFLAIIYNMYVVYIIFSKSRNILGLTKIKTGWGFGFCIIGILLILISTIMLKKKNVKQSK